MSFEPEDENDVEFRESVAAHAYFSNPFWSDPTDPREDPAITSAIREQSRLRDELIAENMRRNDLNLEIRASNDAAREAFVPRDFSKETNIFIILFAVFGVSLLLMIGVSAVAPNSVIVDLVSLPLGISCLFAPICGLLLLYAQHRDRPATQREWPPVHYDARQAFPMYSVEEASIQRYEAFLIGLLDSDPTLYGQIMLWEQQQELIQLQEQSNAQQDAIISNQQDIIRAQKESAKSVSRAIDRQTAAIQAEARNYRDWQNSVLRRDL